MSVYLPEQHSQRIAQWICAMKCVADIQDPNRVNFKDSDELSSVLRLSFKFTRKI